MRVKGAPPCARYAVVSEPGTMFQKVEDFSDTLKGALEAATCYDAPVDVMRILPSGELTTEL